VHLDKACGEFDGQIKCLMCGAILQVKTEGGKLKSAQFVMFTRPVAIQALKRT